MERSFDEPNTTIFKNNPNFKITKNIAYMKHPSIIFKIKQFHCFQIKYRGFLNIINNNYGCIMHILKSVTNVRNIIIIVFFKFQKMV